MAGSTKLMTAGGGGVNLTPNASIAADVTLNLPTAGVNNGTLTATDANGNLGLGVIPSAWSAYRAFQVGNGSLINYGPTNETSVVSNGYYDGASFKYINTAAATRYVQSGGAHNWGIAPSGTAGNPISFTQAMTLDASGNLLVGTTSNPSGSKAIISASGQATLTSQVATTSAAGHILFRNPNGVVGEIDTNGSTTSYVTSSDYRLKENIQPMQGALDVVAQLNPVTYTWKADGSDGQGFIAHELQAVVPDCVTGEKDAVDAEGKPVYQGIDTSFLVATLTKAIQELSAKVDAQQAEINALKGASV